MLKPGTRINKFLSEVGYCSRRQADSLIEQGRVYVDRKPAKMGMKVFEDDLILCKNSFQNYLENQNNNYSVQ